MGLCHPGDDTPDMAHKGHLHMSSGYNMHTCHLHICTHDLTCTQMPSAHHPSSHYGVAATSRIDEMIGLFCKRDL